MELIKPFLPENFSFSTFTNPVYSAYNSIRQIISLALEWICSCCNRSEDAKDSPLARRGISPPKAKSAEDKRKDSHARLLTLIKVQSENNEPITDATRFDELENLLAEVGETAEIKDLVLTLRHRHSYIGDSVNPEYFVQWNPNLVKMAQFNFELDHWSFGNLDAFNSFPNIHEIDIRIPHYYKLKAGDIDFLKRAKSLILNFSDGSSLKVGNLPHFPNLTSFSAHTQSDTADFSHIFTPSLIKLFLTDRGWMNDERLAKLASGSPHLTILYVNGSNLTDNCINELLKLPLERLNITKSKITFDGLCQILENIQAPCEVEWGESVEKSKDQKYTDRIKDIFQKRGLKVEINSEFFLQITIKPNRFSFLPLNI